MKYIVRLDRNKFHKVNQRRENEFGELGNGVAGMHMDFPGSTSGKEPACYCKRHKRCEFDPWVRKIPWRRKWQSTAVFLPGKSHGQRSLEGYSPWVAKS